MCNRYNSFTAGHQVGLEYFLRQRSCRISSRIDEVPPIVFSTYLGHVLRMTGGELVLDVLPFGIVPNWIQYAERKKHRGVVNARSEKLAAAPTWRESFRQRRCVVPAASFIEFPRFHGKAVAHEVFRVDGAPVLFPGIWDRWMTPAGEREGFAIVTVAPHPDLAWLHPNEPRIAAILDESQIDAWMEPGTSADVLQEMLASPDPATIKARPA